MRVFHFASAGFLTFFLSSANAQAGLGEAAGTVTTDGLYFSASVVPTAYGTYTDYVLTLPNGSTVDEYVAGGVIFAVSWQTPGRPDLVHLLGSYFTDFQSEATPPGRGVRRAPPTVDESDLVVVSRGHPGAFSGQAFLRSLVPAGFPLSDLK
jgi:hypothetical protein